MSAATMQFPVRTIQLDARAVEVTDDGRTLYLSLAGGGTLAVTVDGREEREELLRACEDGIGESFDRT